MLIFNQVTIKSKRLMLHHRGTCGYQSSRVSSIHSNGSVSSVLRKRLWWNKVTIM